MPLICLMFHFFGDLPLVQIEFGKYGLGILNPQENSTIHRQLEDWSTD